MPWMKLKGKEKKEQKRRKAFKLAFAAGMCTPVLKDLYTSVS